MNRQKKFLLPLVLIAALHAQGGSSLETVHAAELIANPLSQTNRSVILDEKTAFALTAGLSQYEQLPQLDGKCVSVGGAVPQFLIYRWLNEFTKLYPNAQFEARSGGSSGGLADLLAEQADLATMARPISEEEVARFQAKFGGPPGQIIVAQDALGIYVHKSNPLPGLTLAQLDAIYSREPKRGGGRPEFWSDLGVTGSLADQRISRHSPSSIHASHVFFQESVMLAAPFRFDVIPERTPGSQVQSVGADDEAIGFASVMFATARTRLVSLQASNGKYLLPTYQNTTSGDYPLTRSIRIIFRRPATGSMNPVAREFLRFAVSRRGQRSIALAGTYPLTVAQQTEALAQIAEAPSNETKPK
jgi:phosphate transport system substrate-binding protein